MPYQFVAGYNNAGTLADLTIQPKSPGLYPGSLERAGDMMVYANGKLRTQWIYTSLTISDYGTLMTELGLDADDFTPASVQATVRTKINSTRGFANYNAIVSLTDNFRFDDFWKIVEFDVVIVGTPS